MARVGVIGLGQIGLAHAGNVLSSQGHSIVGLCDANQRLLEIGRGILGSIPLFSDYHKMVEVGSPDAIFVCTPAPSHGPITEDLCNFQGVKGIFVEKPLSTTALEARKMASRAAERSIVTATGFQRRFLPQYQKALANPATSPGFTSKPFTPFFTIPSLPFVLVHTTGLLDAIPSTTVCE